MKIILKDKNHSNLFFTSKRKGVGVLFKIDRKEKRTLTATKKRERFISKKSRFRFWEATGGNQLFQMELSLVAVGHDRKYLSFVNSHMQVEIWALTFLAFDFV